MKRNNITKNEILQNIKRKKGLPNSYLDKIFDSIFDTIKIGLLRDGKYKISGFGTFKVLLKKKRIGMNPKTKIKYPINQRKVVVFSPSKLIKSKINGQ